MTEATVEYVRIQKNGKGERGSMLLAHRFQDRQVIIPISNREGSDRLIISHSEDYIGPISLTATLDNEEFATEIEPGETMPDQPIGNFQLSYVPIQDSHDGTILVFRINHYDFPIVQRLLPFLKK